MPADIILKQKRAERLAVFHHPWVFSQGLLDVGGVESGALARVRSEAGQILGWGLYNANTTIAVRMVRYSETEPESDWIATALRGARERRQRAFGELPETYRLCHGENDGVPGLTVDVFADLAVIQITSMGIDHRRDQVITAVRAATNPTAIYEQSDSRARAIEGLTPRSGFVFGTCDFPYPVREGRLNLLVDPEHDQKTGLFIDQRDQRRWLGERAQDQRVLDLFCNTGGFSLHAARGGAREILAVDASQRALDTLETQRELNKIDAETLKIHKTDVFKWMVPEPDTQWDIVVLDPPSLAKSRKALSQAQRAYRNLNARAAARTRTGGLLMTFSCSGIVTPDAFQHSVFLGLRDVNRIGRVIQRFGPGYDHPEELNFPEGAYFKGMAIQVE